MAAQDYETQPLESVSIRRRLRDALLFGAQRQRQSLDERLRKVLVGVVIAAVVCAGRVGWSFVWHRVIGKSPHGASMPSSQPSRIAVTLALRGLFYPVIGSNA